MGNAIKMILVYEKQYDPSNRAQLLTEPNETIFFHPIPNPLTNLFPNDNDRPSGDVHESITVGQTIFLIDSKEKIHIDFVVTDITVVIETMLSYVRIRVRIADSCVVTSSQFREHLWDDWVKWNDVEKWLLK